jgi:hypothetical protein
LPAVEQARRIELLVICARCPNRQKTCAGACACGISGTDIREHAKDGKCPKGFYNLSAAELVSHLHYGGLPPRAAGPGDLIAWVAKHTGGCALARLYTHITGEPCGCEERREKVNAWWEGVKARLRA